MTYCPALLKKVEQETNNNENTKLRDIGIKICGDTVKKPDLKAKRLIILAKGKKWWDKNKSRYVDESKIHNPKGKSGSSSRKKFRQENIEDVISKEDIKEMKEEVDILYDADPNTLGDKDKKELSFEIIKYINKNNGVEWWIPIECIVKEENRNLLEALNKHCGRTDFEDFILGYIDKIKKIRAEAIMDESNESE